MMKSNNAARAIGRADSIEYCVYIFHHQNNRFGFASSWEKKHTTTHMNKALARAKVLHRSDNYQRVEVKRILRDTKNDRAIDSTVRVFESQPQARRWFAHSVFLKGAPALILGGLCVFGLAYFFGGVR